ncbi:MFS transporter [Streptomyces sp. 5-6(2022)]|uniref:MFS transporter n=1 Tax=Streptomyces sp. 5-6(2022) TaxID=2936510 RepID=UPI0023B8BCED|nr:MFS transporter [Streptomyces sp. 5-6(2022)]
MPAHRERGKLIGMWMMALLAALPVGPVIAGVILDQFTWRWFYLASLRFALLALAVATPLPARGPRTAASSTGPASSPPPWESPRWSTV